MNVKRAPLVAGTPAGNARPLAQARPTAAWRSKVAAVPWDLLMLLVAAMVLTYVWRFQRLFPLLGTLEVPTLVTLGAYVAFVLDRDRRRRLKDIKHPITLLLLAIGFWMVLTIPSSIWPGGSFRFIYRDHAKTLALAILLAASVRSFVDVHRLAGVQVFGATVFVLVVLVQFGFTGGRRLSELYFYDANDLAMLAVCTIPLALYFFASSRTLPKRALSVIALLLLTIAVVRSGSRAGFIGFLVLVFYLLFRYRALPGRLRAAVAAISLAGFVVVASDQYWDRMNTILNPREDYNWAGASETGRMEVWSRGLGYMLDKPVFGVGVRQFARAEGWLAPQAERQRYGVGWRWSAAHNSFIQIGAELGLAGLALFLALLVHAFRAARRAGQGAPRGRRASPEAAMGQALAASLVGYVTLSMFLSQAYSAFIYTVFAMIVGLVKVSAAERERSRGGGALAQRRPDGIKPVRGRPARVGHPRAARQPLGLPRPRSAASSSQDPHAGES